MFELCKRRASAVTSAGHDATTGMKRAKDGASANLPWRVELPLVGKKRSLVLGVAGVFHVWRRRASDRAAEELQADWFASCPPVAQLGDRVHVFTEGMDGIPAAAQSSIPIPRRAGAHACNSGAHQGAGGGVGRGLAKGRPAFLGQRVGRRCPRPFFIIHFSTLIGGAVPGGGERGGAFRCGPERRRSHGS